MFYEIFNKWNIYSSLQKPVFVPTKLHNIDKYYLEEGFANNLRFFTHLHKLPDFNKSFYLIIPGAPAS